MKASLSTAIFVSILASVGCTSNVSLGGAGANLKAGEPCDPSACGPMAASALLCLDGSSVAPQKCVAKGDGTCGLVANTCKVVPADATGLAGITDGDGFTVPPPAGSACRLGQSSYALDLAAKKIAFTVCKAGATAADPYTLSSGSVTVSDAQIAGISEAFEKLSRPTQGICAADLGTSHVEVRQPSKTTSYTDSRLQCAKKGLLFADGVPQAVDALSAAAGNP